MSRIGKKPVVIPKGVDVKLSQESITVKGPKGKLERNLPPLIKVEVNKDKVFVIKNGDTRRHGAFHGLGRSLIANMIKGVSVGFKKDMAIVGVGYKVLLKGNTLTFNLGYSNPIEFALPAGLNAVVGEKGVVFSIEGYDLELLGQTCAKIRMFRPPEPYKGKGVRYADEKVRQKAGKAGVK